MESRVSGTMQVSPSHGCCSEVTDGGITGTVDSGASLHAQTKQREFNRPLL